MGGELSIMTCDQLLSNSWKLNRGARNSHKGVGGKGQEFIKKFFVNK